ncbi:uncharacterized protein PHALS_15021 [Plasmopara halstedii]|uniref:Uncharacterized protein n=1 Tax=Plasmopara halstedii TaxID=4781 RepID=A0A0P1A8T0_PLAHL|nr:uncharacterized protein PHALS_15021 [Plasmopara halstedii]CEG37098.1 hypothetical protein PHALS_15021 [Plasmopara halstedii]|eukprot:XP_024573467.1 hypothetical protein PHALS_15021 [Plasmopara halstedii]
MQCIILYPSRDLILLSQHFSPVISFLKIFLDADVVINKTFTLISNLFVSPTFQMIILMRLMLNFYRCNYC